MSADDDNNNYNEEDNAKDAANNGKTNFIDIEELLDLKKD